MRTIIIILVLSLMAFSSTVAKDNKCCEYTIADKHNCRIADFDFDFDFDCCDWDFDHKCCIGNYSMDIDDGTIILSPRSHGYTKIKITDDCRLYINGQKIELNDEQKELVEEFHDLAMQIKEDAKEIGREGAKIGAAGAQLGVHAFVSVFKLLHWDYDGDDFEREIEQMAAKLEAKAEKLEEKAERIEEMACKLETIEEELEREIPEWGERSRGRL